MPPRATLTFAVFLLEGVSIKKIKMSLKGRKCKYLHCKHILSIYNHEPYCHVHLGLLAYDDKPKAMKVS